MKKYFIFETANLDPRVYMRSLEEPWTARYNIDKSKVILTSLECSPENPECSYYQGTEYSYEDILQEVLKPEWNLEE